MNRLLAIVPLAFAVTVTVGACSADDGSAVYGSSAGGGPVTDCSVYATCGSCTPIEGCGWCFGGAPGMCAPGPGSCASESEFTWTWDPSGCPDVDASVVPLDGGGASFEAGAVSPEAATAVDAATDAADSSSH
jgi:hypothetical protein